MKVDTSHWHLRGNYPYNCKYKLRYHRISQKKLSSNKIMHKWPNKGLSTVPDKGSPMYLPKAPNMKSQKAFMGAHLQKMRDLTHQDPHHGGVGWGDGRPPLLDLPTLDTAQPQLCYLPTMCIIYTVTCVYVSHMTLFQITFHLVSYFHTQIHLNEPC